MVRKNFVAKMTESRNFGTWAKVINSKQGITKSTLSAYTDYFYTRIKKKLEKKL